MDFLLAGTLKCFVVLSLKYDPSVLAGPPHTAGQAAGVGGTWDTGRTEGAGRSTVVVMRRIIEEVGAGAVGEEEGMGMEEKEEVYTQHYPS